jgi:hypothetical protein
MVRWHSIDGGGAPMLGDGYCSTGGRGEVSCTAKTRTERLGRWNSPVKADGGGVLTDSRRDYDVRWLAAMVVGTCSMGKRRWG